MEAASLTPANAVTPGTLIVLGGDMRAHPAVEAALAASGFAMAPTVWLGGAFLDRPAPGPDDIVLHLDCGGEPEALETVREIVEAYPDVALVAVVPADARASVLRKTLRAGAAGIVTTDVLRRSLLPTILAVADGQIAVPRSIRNQLAPRALSFREKQIVGLVVDGFTNREIADRLYLAESTVKTHLSSAFAKLDVKSRAEAAALVLDQQEGHGRGAIALVPGAPLSA